MNKPTHTPTQAERIAALASRLDFDPSTCTADGGKVMDSQGFAWWTFTVEEIKASDQHPCEDVRTAHAWHDATDLYNHKGKAWLIFPL